MLIGDGHARQHGGSEHEEIAVVSMYIPSGQYDCIDNSADSLPSECSIDTTQFFLSLPLNTRGPQTNGISTVDVLNTLAARLIVWEEVEDLRRQLLFRKAGNTVLEKDAR